MKYGSLILIICLSLVVGKLKAQHGFAYGNSGYTYGKSLVYTPWDGGFLLTGSTSWDAMGSSDALVLKIDSTGKIKFRRYQGGLRNDWFNSVLFYHNHFYFAGYTNSGLNGDYNLWFSKADTACTSFVNTELGDSLWQTGNSMSFHKDSTFVIAGQSYSVNGNNGDGLLVNLDTNGTVIWSKTYGGNTTEDLTKVCTDRLTNRLIAVGTRQDSAEKKMAWICLTDSAGNLLTDTVFKTKNRSVFNAVSVLKNGHYLAVGYFEADTGKYIRNLWVEYDSSLAVVRIDSADYKTDEFSQDVIVTPTGNNMVALGSKRIGNGGYGYYDLLLFYMDPNYNFIIGPTYGGVYEDVPSQIIQVNDSVFAVIGNTKNFGPALNHMLVIWFNINHPVITPETFIISSPQKTLTSEIKVINPLEDRIYLLNKNNQLIKVVKIRSADGRLMEEWTPDNTLETLELNLEKDYSAGIYYLSVHTSKGIVNFKMLKR